MKRTTWGFIAFSSLMFLSACLAPAISTPTAIPTFTPTPLPIATPIPSPSPTLSPLPAEVALELVAEGLTAPVALLPVPDGSGRLFIVDQVGVIKIQTSEGILLPEPFLDICHLMVQLNPNYDERGLLGLAFHPDFQQNGRFFVYYTAPPREGAPQGWDHTNHLSEFRASTEDLNRAEPGSERIILQIDHPRFNHNGGQLAFGPDGYLYVGIGDGGGAGDPQQNAQNIEVLLGKILRLDVDRGEPYSIPPDNPFVGREGRDEIFAYGFRNPYRFSFDPRGEYGLLTGDAGQVFLEEVDIVTRGGNYGWRIKEGRSCYNVDAPSSPLASCPRSGDRGEPLIDPIIEYGRDLGQAVIGGFVYRGQDIPQLHGRYIFGDWGLAQGKVFVATPPPSGEGMWSMADLEIAANSSWMLDGFHVLGFGQDSAGELYVLVSAMVGPSGNTGKVLRIMPAP